MEFLNTLNQKVLDTLDEEIKEQLFSDWLGAMADEGDTYLEQKMMQFADPELKRQYNEHYSLKETDEYYL
jgi:hypothetical protein